MEYKLTNNDKTKPLEVEITGDNTFEAAMEDESFKVSFSRISDHHISFGVNGQTINAYVTRTDDAKIIMIQGRTYVVRDADIVEQSRTAGKGMAWAATEVTPPMPAVVILVPVKKGDRVEKGETVATVSAMKMETSLGAPYPGVVTKINVAQGDKVMPGQILVEIEADGD